MYWDRWDICFAYYCYACNYHTGQGSRTYEIFGRLHALEFSPSGNATDPDNLSENGRAIYNQLVEKGYR